MTFKKILTAHCERPVFSMNISTTVSRSFVSYHFFDIKNNILYLPVSPLLRVENAIFQFSHFSRDTNSGSDGKRWRDAHYGVVLTTNFYVRLSGRISISFRGQETASVQSRNFGLKKGCFTWFYLNDRYDETNSDGNVILSRINR